MKKFFLLSLSATFFLAGCSLTSTPSQPIVAQPIKIQPTPVQTVSEQPTEPTICTMEAKLCPDGSYVSRTNPNCAFAKCPDE